MKFDVVVIGAGCTGSLTARELSRYRLRVAVLEAGPDVAWAASRANSAIAHAGYDCQPGTLKAKLNVRGSALMEDLCRELNVEYRRTGSHVIAFDEKDRAHLDELYARGIANGVPGLRILTGEELRAMEPNVSDKAVASLYAPSAGIISSYGLTIAAAESAALNGVEFFLNTPVTAIVRGEDGWTVTAGEREFRADYLVNAAGVNAPQIAALAGERDFPVVSAPSRGQYMILDKQYGSLAHSTLFVCPSEKGKGILVSPTASGNLIVGPNAEPVSSVDDRETTPEGMAEISAGARRIMPNVPLRGVIRSFSGVRPNSNLYDFYIRPSEQLPGLVHAASISSPGLASSPAIAEYIVELLAGLGLDLAKNPDFNPATRADGNHKRFVDMTEEEKVAAIAANPAYGRVICRCETVTEGDILDVMHAPIPAVTVDMVKHRLRAGMGRCQGGFCSPRVVELLANEKHETLDKVTQFGGGSWIVLPRETTEGGN